MRPASGAIPTEDAPRSVQRLIWVLVLLGLGLGCVMAVFNRLQDSRLTEDRRRLLLSLEEFHEFDLGLRARLARRSDLLEKVTAGEPGAEIQAELAEMRASNAEIARLLQNLAVISEDLDIRPPLTALGTANQAWLDVQSAVLATRRVQVRTQQHIREVGQRLDEAARGFVEAVWGVEGRVRLRNALVRRSLRRTLRKQDTAEVLVDGVQSALLGDGVRVTEAASDMARTATACVKAAQDLRLQRDPALLVDLRDNQLLPRLRRLRVLFHDFVQLAGESGDLADRLADARTCQGVLFELLLGTAWHLDAELQQVATSGDGFYELWSDSLRQQETMRALEAELRLADAAAVDALQRLSVAFRTGRARRMALEDAKRRRAAVISAGAVLAGCGVFVLLAAFVSRAIRRIHHSERQALNAFRESQQLLRLVLDAIPVRVFWKDRQSVYLGCNQPFAADAGLDSPEEIVGRTDYELCWKKSEADFFRECDARVMESNTPEYHIIEPQLHADAQQAWLDTNKVPLRDADGRAVGILGTYEDITAQRQAETVLREAKEAAEEANRLKTQFLANVSHEIRTPLNAIIGFAELITDTGSAEPARRHAGTILDEAEHLLGLINDLLDNVKIDAGRVELTSEPVDLPALLRGVLAGAEVLAKSKGLQLHLAMAEGTPAWVQADGLRLRQILVNLVSNAVKFTEQGSVSIRTERVSTDERGVPLRFSVVDTGIGIPPEKQRVIFDRFMQADGSTTREYGGTGLGTTIARQLVELMGGEIGLDSEPGRGSTFWFTVPLAPCAAPSDMGDGVAGPRGSGEPQEASSRRAGRILLVEDYALNREAARAHLTGAGHTVDAVENGELAVEACRRQGYDLVLMDVQMPRMDGYEATRRIRAQGGDRSLPILGLTAHTDAGSRAACLEAGMDDVVNKPIRRTPLLATIDAWLARGGAGGESGTAPGAAAGPATAPVPLDYAVLLDEFGGAEQADRLLDHFLDSVAGQLDVMGQAVEERNLEQLRREAHSLKGAAATLEAVPLAEAAKRLETLSAAGQTDALADALTAVSEQVASLRAFVEDRRASSASAPAGA